MTQEPIQRDKMMAHYGKSFHWAAMVLPKKQFRDAKKVYAFCRFIDDIVDETQDKQSAQVTLEQIKQAIRKKQSSLPIVAEMIECQQRLDIPETILMQLIEGVGTDLSLSCIEDERALLRYSYGVASTVGLLMCYVFGVRDPQAHRFAIDLGLAMQLTNIARDVIEDAERGRVYLPKTWCDKDIQPESLLAQPELSEKNYAALKHIIKLADRYYQSADAGLAYLPWRARMSIIIASRVYQAIGHKVAGLSQRDYITHGRVYTTRWEKIKLSTKALMSLLLERQYRKSAKQRHQGHLHFRIEDCVRDVC